MCPLVVLKTQAAFMLWRWTGVSVTDRWVFCFSGFVSITSPSISTVACADGFEVGGKETLRLMVHGCDAW